MMTDTEIRLKGIQVLTAQMGDVEAERFIALIQREPFDYTKWRQDLDDYLSIEEISKKAMALRENPTDRFLYTKIGYPACRGEAIAKPDTSKRRT